MMASLYQRRSFSGSASLLRAGTSVARWSMLGNARSRGKIVELLLAPLVAAESEDVRRADLRVQLDVVAPPAPQVTRVGAQVVRLERLSALDTQLVQLE